MKTVKVEYHPILKASYIALHLDTGVLAINSKVSDVEVFYGAVFRWWFIPSRTPEYAESLLPKLVVDAQIILNEYIMAPPYPRGSRWGFIRALVGNAAGAEKRISNYVERT